MGATLCGNGGTEILMSDIKTFKHSGNLGDIVYSLPTIIALGGGILYLNNRVEGMRIEKNVAGPQPMMTAEMMSGIMELLTKI